MEKTEYFTYNNGEDVTKGAFRISASQVSRFFDYTSQWYREHLLGEEGFTGNTATNLGTVVHAGIEMFIKEGRVDYSAIENHIDAINHPEIDTFHIREQYPNMLDAILPLVEADLPEESEKFIWHELLPGIGVGGTIDALKGDTIRDWKTTSSRTLPTKFSRSYWFQQMTYAFIMKKLGVHINYIELVFVSQNEMNRVSDKTGKRLKDYPSITSVVREEVTTENLELIESCLMLIAESVKMWQEQPEIRHILAQDMRLKPKTPPKLFV